MKFMLLITNDEVTRAKTSQEDNQKMYAAYMKYTLELKTAGVMVGGDPLQPEKEGARVRVRAGKRTVVDGPFAETKEVLGGYYILECATKAEAIDWAAKCPGAEIGTLEVRPIMAM